MDKSCFTLDVDTLSSVDDATKHESLYQLESGRVLYFPTHTFALFPEEQALLTDTLLDGSHKNVSFDIRHEKLSGYNKTHQQASLLKPFMHRYALFAKELISTLIPEYQDALRWGRTSYRPAEIKGRTSSKRKDDTRLHVDSFSATPVNGLRILRVFCNINPFGEPRVWHTGEPFEQVLSRFAPKIPEYNSFQARLLHWLKITKTLRSPYDHYMLQLHDRMKLDKKYQHTVTKNRIEFPPASSWIVFTDHVSHAALGGQYLLEQTFYLPVEAMQYPEFSPLNQWQNHLKKSLKQDRATFA